MKNPVAEVNKPDSLIFVKPDSAAGDDAEIVYFCPDPQCLDPDRTLLMKRSNLGNPYFSHRPGYDHDVHPKMLFHKMILAEFKNMKRYVLPERINGKRQIEIDWSKSTVNFNGLDADMPDIRLVDRNGFECFVEATINYPVNDKKLSAAKKHDLPLVELNLYRLFIENDEKSRDHFDFLIFHASEMANDASNAQFVFIPERLKVKKHVFSSPTLIGGAVLLGVAALIAYFSLRDR